MTDLMDPARSGTGIFSIGEPRLLRGLQQADAIDLPSHVALNGPLPVLTLDALIAACEAVDLAGRGGAGFPVARKLRGLAGSRPVVVVNGSESEPCSRKDRALLRHNPHLVLDGAKVVADAIGARRIRIAVHDEYTERAIQHAIAQRPDGRAMQVHAVTGGFVAGEARAVIRALDGQPGLPSGRRILPTVRGVGGAPTLLSNVETFAHIALLARLGPQAYAACGTRNEPGTTLLTVSGAVARPAVIEIPFGTTLGEVFAAAGARSPAAVVLGGFHGTWLAPQPSTVLSRNGLQRVGATLGAGVVIVLDETTCALGELASAAAWLAAQSAQQCGPCMFGLPALADDVRRLARGDASAGPVAQRHARAVVGRGACAHPDGASRFVTSGLALLGPEIEVHRRHGNCGRPVRGQIGAPTPQRRAAR